MTVVEDLLANAGVYVGIDTVADSDLRGAARMVIAPLPGGAGVTLDYEIFNPATPDRIRGHMEHTIVARTHDGGAVMVIGHDHAQSVTILRETDPGMFELAEDAPFPMKVHVSLLEAGRIRHAWWYGMPGEDAVERDVAVLARTT